MADRTSRDGGTRRQAFRRVRADAGLPDEYLELLEQKRKQLDDSIHKYIASKERDFKTYERELQQQYKQDKQEQSQNQHQNQEGGSRAARPSSGSISNGSGSPQLRAQQQQQQQQQQQSVVDALLAAGVNQEHIGQPLSVAVVDVEGSPRLEAKSAAGLIDRKASLERDKEFVGVFTPAFLPALDNKASSSSSATTHAPERAESAPPGQSKEIEQPTILRAHSDHLAQAQAKRPVQLQLTHRTSSSGSSADGKLTSALKSPTQGKSRRKRVSLAVGDTIVKPSDSVPTSLLNNNRTPSHSRTRSQPPDPNREQSIDAKIANGNGTRENEVEVQATSPQVSVSVPVEPAAMPEVATQRPPAAASVPNGKSAVAPSSPLSRPPARPPTTIDADGDLFDLEEEDMLSNGGGDVEPFSESEDGIAGRVDRNYSSYSTDDNSAVASEAEYDEYRAEHLEFLPGSAVASQQPTNPGFRRPSVAMDPIYSGPNYNRVEHDAVVNDVYGSSYNRPATKGSFTSGSLGESFMARNAQHMRTRSGSKSIEQTEVRS